MKQTMKKIHQILKSRKLRAGGFSLLLTVLLSVAVLLLGALGDGLEKRYALQADFSFNGATTQGEVTRNALNQLDKDVVLYAVCPLSGGDETLLSLLNRYAASSDKVSIKQESLIANPVLSLQFTDAMGVREVSEDCLIVHCPQTNLSRVLTREDFILYSYNLETGLYDEAQYSYEKSVTEAILFVTQDEVPTVQILSGHGEKTESEIALMVDTLLSANYRVEFINLSAGGQLKEDSPLLILSPRYDLSEEELSALMDFARAGGDFFISSSYADPTYLPNFQALLRAYGVSWYPGMVIAKEEDKDSYYASSPTALMPYLQETDMTRALLSGNENVYIFSSARAFQLPDTVPDGVMLSPVFITGESYIRNFGDGESTSRQQPGDLEGRFAVALWADKLFDQGTISHAFVIGDLTMFTDYWMIGNTSSTPLLLQSIRTLRGKEPVNLNILPITAQREGLQLGGIGPAVIAAAMLPLLVLLGALLVLWPRKNL